MAVAAASCARVTVDGKFFRAGEKKFFARGVAYGPLAPNAAGRPFASPEQTVADFQQIATLGANVLRVYDVPEKWFLDLAEEHGLKVLIDIPWNQHLCFLESEQLREDARAAVRRAVHACGRHPAVFAFSVANEIPPDVVRWSGARAVAGFVDELIAVAKQIEPECLCTYANFPPTEFLRPQAVDFVCFNVYLHNEQPFKNYLARLQMQADGKPLLLGEIGIDSLREGESRKSDILAWQIRDLCAAGLAGAVIFSYTDEWWKGGRLVEGWQMGLTTREREPRESFWAVQKIFRAAPYFPPAQTPKISVVVASYNAARTLPVCLDSLQRLNYPAYEVILVDDGSSDSTAQVASRYPRVRYLRHETNLGLSAARNTGIAAAGGEIIAFTDADCRADEDWLYYLAADLLNSEFVGIGGPNLLPPEDSPVAAAVMASPGGPAHVMLTDRQAEHLPGCNMAFYKWALNEIGGFDPVFRQAGDDVDLCWRLQQAGHTIGFSPAGFVWHFRRSTVAEYLKQQQGYGAAEALLVRKHPEYFNSFGGSIWRGRIYTSSKFGVLLRPSIIYRGLFGSAGFQGLYASEPALTLMLCTSLEFHLLVTLPLWIFSAAFHALLPLAITSMLVSVAVCGAAGAQAVLPRSKLRPWSRPLVALLFFLQPVVRGWARYRGRLLQRRGPLAARQTLDSIALRQSGGPLDQACYWSSGSIDRLALVAEILRRLEHHGWPCKPDIGWSDYDVEVCGGRWSCLQLTTATEEHGGASFVARIRLRSRWSFQAAAAFWALGAALTLALSFLVPQNHWFWLLLLTLPMLLILFNREQRILQSTMIVLLDEMARDLGFSRVQNLRPVAGAAPSAANRQPSPAAASLP